MLKSLAIQNYALIDSLTIDFDNGFSVITGETGAGKSIILGALSLILGKRAETRYIKQGASKCTIEGIFDISNYNLRSFFDERDWLFESNECILRREVWASGKSRTFVNDSPVYLNDLKELGDRLIDIHSQHENLSLNDNIYQLNALDVLSQAKSEKEFFEHSFKVFQAAKKELEELVNQSLKNKQEEDYLQFQFNALSEANLHPHEQDDLEAELSTMTHAEEIKTTLFTVVESFSGEGKNVEHILKSTADNLRQLIDVYPTAEELAERIESAYLELKDVRQEASKRFEEIEFNPERHQIVQDRLSLVYELQKKYNVQTVCELLQLQEEIEQKLQRTSSVDAEIERKQKDVSEKETDMLAKADALSKKRTSAIQSIEKQLTEKLSFVGMPHARFKCSISDKTYPDVTGKDNVQFLFSANKNVALQPVSQVASGGEISRLMLCVKAMIAGATALPTIIFDEIDTGTSGEIADKMGTIMREMSQNMQVIAITHLPQIAAKGKTHYIVYKDESNDITTTYMRKLSSEERIEEIARMLSGAKTTAQAIENAKVMLSV